MNKEQRKRLNKAIELINTAKEIIEEVGSEEQEKFDNLPEGLQASEKGQALETAAGVFETTVSNLDETVADLEEQM